MAVKLLPHNEETYGRMVEMFETDKRVAVVQPTGTGKSFLILKWIEDHPDENILVMSPSNVIFKQLERYAKCSKVCLDNMNVCTYAKLNRSEPDDVAYIKASKIVLDEFHRTGAEKWCENIGVLLDSHEDSQILGLTATPVRYLDRSRNMAAELFDENYARYMELSEAIVDGILPVPKYVPVWYDYNEELTLYQEDINNLKIAKAKREAEETLQKMRNNLQNSYGAEVMFKKYMVTNGKYIVFCKHQAHLQLMKNMMKHWLRDINTNIKFYTTTYFTNDKDQQVQDFIDDENDDSIRLLFSIDRLNEGLHVPGIDGVVMLRPTDSPIIFLQQMGRAFATDNKQPLIFDMVNNYKNVKVADPEGNPINFLEYQLRILATHTKINIDDIIFGIFEDAKTFDEVLKEFKSRLSKFGLTWMEHFELLKEFKEEFNRFPKKGEIYKGIKIASWVQVQKISFKNNMLSKERQEKLKSIGIVFDNMKDAQWNKNFELLKEFKEEFNTFPNYKAIYKGTRIGLWLNRQKNEFNKCNLSKERQEKLKSIGVVFDNMNDIQWDKKFKLLKEFINKFNRLPKQDEKYNGVNIGIWLSDQIQLFNKSKLSKERQEKLLSIRVIFDNYYNIQWNKNFELLKEFKEEFDREPIKDEKYKGTNIGLWLNRQKVFFNKSKLSKEKQELLESIGVIFKTRHDIQWDKKFELLKEFIIIFNRTPKIYELYKGIRIGTWLNTQKTKFREGKLSKERQEKLESLGVEFTKKEEE